MEQMKDDPEIINRIANACKGASGVSVICGCAIMMTGIAVEADMDLAYLLQLVAESYEGAFERKRKAQY
jgi:hypothetical protein